MSSTGIVSIYEGKDLAEIYYKARPKYPSFIVDNILQELRSLNPERGEEKEGRFGRMLDIGCGGGQATFMFEPYFDSILGIDVSAGQIAVAKEKNKSQNIEFQVVQDFFLPVEDGSVDLVNCAATITFLDIDVFTSECKRVLKPDGCVAIYSVIPIGVKKEYFQDGNSVVKEYYEEYMNLTKTFLKDCYAHPLYDRWVNLYKEPFKGIKNKTKRWLETPNIAEAYSTAKFKHVWLTLGDYVSNKDKFAGKDPLDEFASGVRKLFGECEDGKDLEFEFQLVFHYPMFVFHKQ